jgi:hypothetical protein
MIIADLKKRFVAQQSKVDPLFAIVLASRGGGKSGLIGTLKKPTLYLYLLEENHGLAAARAVGKGNDLSGVCLNMDAAGKVTSTPENNPDGALKELYAILDTDGLEKEFGAVALDGFSALDRYIYMSSEVQKASKYDQNKAILAVYDRIIGKLKALNFKGLDVIVTCASEGQADSDGKSANLTPKLRGTGTVDSVIGQFAEVLVVGKVEIADGESGEVEPTFALQFGTQIEKSGKRITGQSFGVTFRPRIACLRHDQTPSLMPADLSLLQKLKTDRAGK